MMAQIPASLRIVGAPVTPFESLEAAVRCADDRIASGRQTFCVAINPEKIQRASRDPALKDVLELADFRICDGVGVSIAALLVHRRRLARCTGVDMFVRLCGLAAAKRWSVFLLGGAPESNAGAARTLVRWFPGIEVAGRRHGYFSDSEDVVNQINASRARMLFVGLGSPRQEFWIAQRLHELQPTLLMGVGGSFDVLSGKARRAPRLFRATGTEWLFRLATEPQRTRRQMALPAFAVRVARQALASRTAA